MYVKPSQALKWIAIVSDPENGELMNADSLPTGVLYKNLAATAVTVTVTNITTGIYGVSVTVPVDWVAADVGSVVLTAAIDAMNFGASVEFAVDTKRTSDLQDLSQANIRTAVGLATANLDTQLADIPTVAEMNARTVTAATYATASAVAAIATILSGITSLAAWLRVLARSSTADATAKSEINSGGGTYDEATDSLEAGVASVAYTISNVDITPPSAVGLTTGYILCLGTDGLPESGVTVKAKMCEGPGTGGYALDTGEITMTSGADGIAQHTGFVRGAKYNFQRGSGAWGFAQTAPDSDAWELTEILGET